jgi:hypothetical protein
VVTGQATQSIYYAKNIAASAANANTVTVRFNLIVPYPDVRALEYSGVGASTPLDTTAATSGTGATPQLLPPNVARTHHAPPSAIIAHWRRLKFTLEACL